MFFPNENQKSMVEVLEEFFGRTNTTSPIQKRFVLAILNASALFFSKNFHRGLSHC